MPGQSRSWGALKTTVNDEWRNVGEVWAARVKIELGLPSGHSWGKDERVRTAAATALNAIGFDVRIVLDERGWGYMIDRKMPPLPWREPREKRRLLTLAMFLIAEELGELNAVDGMIGRRLPSPGDSKPTARRQIMAKDAPKGRRYEGSPQDKREDRAGAKRAGLTHRAYERTAKDRAEDRAGQRRLDTQAKRRK